MTTVREPNRSISAPATTGVGRARNWPSERAAPMEPRGSEVVVVK